MTDDITYPSVENILTMHEWIVNENSDTSPGVRKREAVESALLYVSEGYFGECPETVHEKATHLMRLLVADHPFVDGNKRTALNATATFYAMNGYYFDYGREIKDTLKRFGRGDDVDVDPVIDRCEAVARPVEEVDDEGIQAEIERLQERVK